MLLNCLYGTFGRTKDIHKCVHVHASKLPFYLDKYVVTSMIDLGDNMFTLIVQNNLNLNLLNELNNTVSTDHKFINVHQPVMNNVAIASATTSYARIVMMPYKLDPSCVYSDTDSVFTKDVLKIINEGTELGEFKDELNGIRIEEGTFLGIKQYGYKYKLPNGKTIEKSVFAGVQRDSLTYKQIQKLSKGRILTVESKLRFNKCFNKLNISITKVNLNIKQKAAKPLVNNEYLPLNIDLISNDPLTKLVNRYLRGFRSLYNRAINHFLFITNKPNKQNPIQNV